MSTAPQLLSKGESLEVSVAAELRVPLVTARVVRFSVRTDEITFPAWSEGDSHRLDLTLTPRPSGGRARYPERWGPGRYERMGDIMCHPAGEPVQVVGAPTYGSWTSINCLLSAEPIRNFFENDLAFTDDQLDASLDIRSESIRNLLLRLGEEARHPGFASEMLAELIAGQIVVELFRYRDDVAGWAKGGLAPWRLRLIDERLVELSTVPTLAELAENCGLSVRQLTRGFRVSRGCSIGAYVAEVQIQRAKRLLASDESISSISSATGFSSLASFSNAFRRATGESPREYRQREHRIRH